MVNVWINFNSKWFIPTFAFNTTTFVASLIFFALATEALGDSKLAADVTGNKYEPDKVILGNGVASIVGRVYLVVCQ